MAKVVKSALGALKKFSPNSYVNMSAVAPKQFGKSSDSNLLSGSVSSPLSLPMYQISRTHASFSSQIKSKLSNTTCRCTKGTTVNFYSTEVDKEISSFLAKEIQYETSRASSDLPKIRGFDVKTEGGDVTLTKSANGETIVVKMSVNGAVDSVAAPDEQPSQDEPPQMVCRPPFEIEMTKESGSVLALQCSFPSTEEPFQDAQQEAHPDKIEDQFEIQEVAFHNGEWKDTTFAVSAATMDAELFDLLMDMLDERGINDEFIAQLVDFCTAYENKQYIEFLKSLKSFADK